MTYDPTTIERLKARHDTERVRAILAGLDGVTNADLAAWRRLGVAEPRHDPLADPLTPELRAKVETVFERVKP
jgi:hypothetical protein